MNLSQANKPHMKDMIIFSPVLLSKYDIPLIRPPVEQTKSVLSTYWSARYSYNEIDS